MTFQGVTLRMQDSKGMHYLAHLLRHPDERIDVRDLAAVTGPRGGTRRRSSSDGRGTRREDDRDRPRSAVTKRIRAAIEHLRKHHPALGRFLMASIHTGYNCVYQIDPERPVRWDGQVCRSR